MFTRCGWPTDPGGARWCSSGNDSSASKVRSVFLIMRECPVLRLHDQEVGFFLGSVTLHDEQDHPSSPPRSPIHRAKVRFGWCPHLAGLDSSFELSSPLARGPNASGKVSHNSCNSMATPTSSRTCCDPHCPKNGPRCVILPDRCCLRIRERYRRRRGVIVREQCSL